MQYFCPNLLLQSQCLRYMKHIHNQFIERALVSLDRDLLHFKIQKSIIIPFQLKIMEAAIRD